MITSHTNCSVPGAVVCVIGRELDFRNAAYFHRQYDELLDRGFRYFVLDFSATMVFDSSGLGAVFGLYKRVAPLGGRVAFATPSRPVESVMRLIRSERLFQHYPSVEAALHELPVDTAIVETTGDGAAPACDPEPAAAPSAVPEPAPEIAPFPADDQTCTMEQFELLDSLPSIEPSLEPDDKPQIQDDHRETVAPTEAAAIEHVEEAADEPSATDEDPPVETEEEHPIAIANDRNETAPAPRYVAHTIVRAEAAPAPLPSSPSPPIVIEEQPQEDTVEYHTFQKLLDLATAYGLIYRYSLQPTHVLLHLFADEQPLDMEYDRAEQFLLELTRGLPMF